MNAAVSRREVLLGAGAALLGGACRSAAGEPGVLRIGLIANLTHGPMLAALASRSLADSLAPLKVEARLFRAGPRVVEAIVGRAVDVGVTGPAPVVFTHARHGDGTLRVLSGCASGGASLVVRPGLGIKSAHDFRGKALAVTTVGSTQDISARQWLRSAGLRTKEHGGDVAVFALAPPVIKGQMGSGELLGAWLPEPWASRLVLELGAERLIDERDLWPGRRFASAITVARGDFLDHRSEDVRRAIATLHTEIAKAGQDPARLEGLAYEELKRRIGNPGPRRAFQEAMHFIDFTADCMQEPIRQFAQDATAAGFVGAVDVSGLFARPLVAET